MLSAILLKHSLELLLWRLRRQPALYILGAGASAPAVALTPGLMRQVASAYIDLGAFPCEPAPETLLTDRLKRVVRGFDPYPDRPLRPGTPDFPSDEILLRLSHEGAIAGLVHYLAQFRFTGRFITNFGILRAFWPSLIMTYNLDGLAIDGCGPHHRVIDMHGSVEAGYGGPGGAEVMRIAQLYGIDIGRDDLILCGPEPVSDMRLHRKLQVMLHSNPKFVMFVG